MDLFQRNRQRYPFHLNHHSSGNNSTSDTMGKQRRRGQAHQPAHQHHAEGQGTHHKHRYHEGSYYKSHHHDSHSTDDSNQQEGSAPTHMTNGSSLDDVPCSKTADAQDDSSEENGMLSYVRKDPPNGTNCKTNNNTSKESIISPTTSTINEGEDVTETMPDLKNNDSTDNSDVDMGYEVLDDLDERYETRLDMEESEINLHPEPSNFQESFRLGPDDASINLSVKDSDIIVEEKTTVANGKHSAYPTTTSTAPLSKQDGPQTKKRTGRFGPPLSRNSSSLSDTLENSFRSLQSGDDEGDDDESKTLGNSILAHSLMGMALQLTSQEWSQLGKSETSIEADMPEVVENTPPIFKTEELVERLTSLMLVRLLAVAAPPGTFPDLSTSTICRTVLVQPTSWPESITLTVLEELRAYVTRIVEWYRPYVPYHNAEHCYHVSISTNKLMDLMLGKNFGVKVVPPTFGLRHDPLRLMALMFSALIHDVDHHGVPNRQLATEDIDHPLAIRYNDQSIAENQSLFLAFDELLHGIDETDEPGGEPQPSYANLRKVMCPTKRDYFQFRKHAINLVLNTDIASPEKTQLSRSKFKEANFDGSQKAAAEATKEKEKAKQRRSKSNSQSGGRKIPARTKSLDLDDRRRPARPNLDQSESEISIESNLSTSEDDQTESDGSAETQVTTNTEDFSRRSAPTQPPKSGDSGSRQRSFASKTAPLRSALKKSSSSRSNSSSDGGTKVKIRTLPAGSESTIPKEANDESHATVRSTSAESVPFVVNGKEVHEIGSRKFKRLEPVDGDQGRSDGAPAPPRRRLTMDNGDEEMRSGQVRRSSDGSEDHTPRAPQRRLTVDKEVILDHEARKEILESSAKSPAAQPVTAAINGEKQHSVPDVDQAPHAPERTQSGEDGPATKSDPGEERRSNERIPRRRAPERSLSSAMDGPATRKAIRDGKVKSNQDPHADQESTGSTDAPPSAPRRRLSDGMGTNSYQKGTSSRHNTSTNPSPRVMKRNKRLGIRRSMDLSGEMLQQYHSSTIQAPSLNDDQPDELKAAVVMDTLMTAADIAQNLQSWDHMVKWSNRLYLELRRAHVAGRGPDVSSNWFKNQIGFLEMYVLPLANKLNESGVFGSIVGPSFARLVEANRDRWLLDGEKVTDYIIAKGKKLFPEGTPIPDNEYSEIDPAAERALLVSQELGNQSPSKVASGTASRSPGKVTEMIDFYESKSNLLQKREQQLEEAQVKIDSLVESHEKAIAKIASNHNTKVDDLEHELEDVTEELEKARNTIASLKSERDRKNKSTRQKRENNDLEAERLREKIKELEQEKASAQKEVDTLREEMQEQKNSFEMQQSILQEEREVACAGLKELMSHRSRELARIEGGIMELQEELSRLLIQGTDKSGIKSIKSRIETRRRERLEAKSLLTKLRLQYDKATGMVQDDSEYGMDFSAADEDQSKDSEDGDEITDLPGPFVGRAEHGIRVFEAGSSADDKSEMAILRQKYEEDTNRLELEREILKDNHNIIYSELKELLIRQHEQNLTFKLDQFSEPRHRKPHYFWTFLRLIFFGIFIGAMVFLYSRRDDIISRFPMDTICAPALPGTRIPSGARLEAPWWVPKGAKEFVFHAVCSDRFATTLEYNGRALIMSYKDSEQNEPFVHRVSSKGVFVAANQVINVDMEGKYREIDAPWTQAHDVSSVVALGNMAKRGLSSLGLDRISFSRNHHKQECHGYLPHRLCSNREETSSSSQ